jgi:hypothetical protein
MYDPRTLIGKQLKSPECQSLLAEFGLSIEREVDPLHAGVADVHWIRDRARGCTWAADEHQEITVAFVQMRAEHGENAFPWAIPGIHPGDDGLIGWGAPDRSMSIRSIRMARYDRPNLTTHVDWDAAGLIKLTFMVPRKLPE